MKSLSLIVVAIVIFPVISVRLHAQSHTYRKINQTTNEVNSTLKNTQTSIDSAARAIQGTRKALSELIPTKKTKSTTSGKAESHYANTVATTAKIVNLSISDMEYEDDNLELLCNSLKSIPGVTEINKNYKNNTVGIGIKSKLTALSIWDAVPKNIRKLFKMIESNDNAMLLKYKTETSG